MAFSSSSSALSASPNVTPLIDVLLVLLIIFMTIVPVSSHGLETVLPESSPSSTKAAADVPPAMLDVQAPGGAGQPIRYRFEGQNTDIHHLRVLLQQAQARSLTRTILIGGDPQLDFQPVVSAISEAQQAGFRIIGLLPRQSHDAR